MKTSAILLLLALFTLPTSGGEPDLEGEWVSVPVGEGPFGTAIAIGPDNEIQFGMKTGTKWRLVAKEANRFGLILEDPSSGAGLQKIELVFSRGKKEKLRQKVLGTGEIRRMSRPLSETAPDPPFLGEWFFSIAGATGTTEFTTDGWMWIADSSLQSSGRYKREGDVIEVRWKQGLAPFTSLRQENAALVAADGDWSGTRYLRPEDASVGLTSRER